MQRQISIAHADCGCFRSCSKLRGVGRTPEYRDFVTKKIAAGICGILLGGFGVHKFLLGLNTPAIIMLCVSIASYVTGVCIIIPLLAAFAMQIVGLVEGILYLTKTDEEFYQTYAVEKREWF